MIRGTLTYDYGFAQDGENSDVEFQLELDYTYVPGQPAKLWPWPGEPGYGPEIEITPSLKQVNADKTLTALPPEVEKYLLSFISLEDYHDAVREDAEDPRED